MQDRGGVVAISRQVKPGYEEDFEEAVRAVILVAKNFPGYVGGEVLYPKTKHGEWELILRFDTSLHLQEWEASAICQSWIERADALSLGAPKIMRVNGLEAWFALPEVPNALPPPKWKTAFVSAVGLYPHILHQYISTDFHQSQNMRKRACNNIDENSEYHSPVRPINTLHVDRADAQSLSET